MKDSWAAYYQNAYAKEKKKNTALAGEVADAEAKREELRVKYTAICGNPFYRAARLATLPGRACAKAARKIRALLRGGENRAVPEEMVSSYQERLARQRDVYGQWIREEEPAVWRKWEDFLQNGPAVGSQKRSCLVISYQELSGVRDLTQITGAVAPDLDGGRRAPDVLLFAEKPEDLEERAALFVGELFDVYPEIKLFYGAEDHRAGKDRRFPWFKPAFSPDTLLGFWYLGSYFAVDRSWAERTPLPGYGDPRQNLYAYMLDLLKPYFQREKDLAALNGMRCLEEKECVPEILCSDLILYHRRGAVRSEIPADREYFLHTGEMREGENPEFWGYEKEYGKLKEAFLRSLSLDSLSLQTFCPDVWSVVPRVSEETCGSGFLLSVVIPSKDHPALLEKCIGSFLERTHFPGMRERVEFIVVDNGSDEKNRLAVSDLLEAVDAECRYLYRPMPYNFSAMCNSGVREARGEFVLLLNDDIEIIEENWLRILLGQALLPGVGAVGAKLWYPEGEKIQHAGVTNMGIGPSHKLVTFPDDRTYYYGRNTVTYNMAAVTAACVLVRRSLYREVGGLAEELAVAYNDVDFCFKLAEAGYRNVIRNDAVLLHHESASRGLDEESEEKWDRLLREKAKLYGRHPLFRKRDPYYSEQLVDNAPDYRIGYRYPYERLLLTVAPKRREKRENLRRHLFEGVMLTLERVGKQHKIHLNEPDILEAEGWCYLLGQDNCQFERLLILEAKEGDFYYQAPVHERLRPDVEAILPQQKNIELSGFTCRILQEDLIAGTYTVGMLYRNLQNGKLYYRRGRTIEIR